MLAGPHIEAALGSALARLDDASTPPRLRAAMTDAVFPGGGRLRPTLCLAVVEACTGTPPTSGSTDVAAALELLHCASLVHDDLPCFDDAPIRRGRPSVHSTHGESIAVLAGDGLIMLAFELLATADIPPTTLAPMLRVISRAVGPAQGLVAGQAWESEPSVPLRRYHAAKTGALFEASARAGALLAKADAAGIEGWSAFGAHLGQAYQVADDLHDARDTGGTMGKPVGKDAELGRPNAALRLGKGGALHRLHELLDRCLENVPPCSNQAPVEAWLDHFGGRLLSATSPRLTASNSDAPDETLRRATAP
jgi:geranylgeranyl diphosphate synthase type II